MADAIELPPGFVLDVPTGLPEGFVLDSPVVAETEALVTVQEPIEDEGLISRIQTVFKERGSELDEIRDALALGEQTTAESMGQFVGKTLAGGALDVAGEIIQSGFEVVSDITPDFIGEPIAEGTTAALEWVLESDIGQLGIEAARAGEETYEEFKAENPRAARNIESVFNVGLIAAPGAAALKTGSKVPSFTKQALAGAPDSEALFKKATEKFTKVKQSGSVLDADTFVDFMGEFENAFSKQIDPGLHPKLTGALNLLEKRIGEDLDIDDLLIVRRNIGSVGRSLDPDERRLGANLMKGFDDFVENLPGSPDWIKARKLYSQGVKTEILETAIDKAGKTVSGIENGLRIEFRKLLNNKREIRRFSKTERAAMEKVVDGDFTTNNLRKLGGIGFGAGQQRSPLTGLAAVAVGGEVAGGAGAVAAPIVGRISQGFAEARTMRSAQIAKALTAGVVPELPTRLGPAIKRGVAASLIADIEGAETQQDVR